MLASTFYGALERIHQIKIIAFFQIRNRPTAAIIILMKHNIIIEIIVVNETNQ
jgi:hypothetical protein